MKNKKGAMELSMTTIIIIILGITLLSLGIVFIKGIFGKINLLTEEAFENAQKEINEKMGADEKFYIPGLQFEVAPGKSKTINLGVQNIGTGGTAVFKIFIEGKDTTINDQWDTGGNKPGEGWETPMLQIIKLAEKKAMPIAVTVPKTAIPGDLVYFTIRVTCTCDDSRCDTTICDGSTTYDSEQLIIKVG